MVMSRCIRIHYVASCIFVWRIHFPCDMRTLPQLAVTNMVLVFLSTVYSSKNRIVKFHVCFFILVERWLIAVLVSSKIPYMGAIWSWLYRKKRFVWSNSFDLWTRKWEPAPISLDSLLAFVFLSSVCTRLNSTAGLFFRKRINSTVILIGGVRSRWTIDLWNRKSNERIVHLSRTVTRSVLPMIYYRTFYTRRTFDLNQHPIKNAYSQSHTCINWLDWFDFDLNCAPNSID